MYMYVIPELTFIVYQILKTLLTVFSLPLPIWT